jgi:hypothetical protein
LNQDVNKATCGTASGFLTAHYKERTLCALQLVVCLYRFDQGLHCLAKIGFF